MWHYFLRNLLVCALVFIPCKSFALDDFGVLQEDTSIEECGEVADLASLVCKEVPLEQLESRSRGYAYGREDKVHSYSHRRKGDEASRKSMKPHFESGNQVQSPSSIFFRTDIGAGFLYFKGVRGNFAGVPSALYVSQPGNAPYKGSLTYNRTPAFEYMAGYRFLSYFKAAVAYLHQGNVTVQTKQIPAGTPNVASNVNFAQLSSNLSLDAVLFKLYVESPWPLFWRSIMTNAYLGSGVGIGWQSWTNTKINRVTVNTNYFGKAQPIRQQVGATTVWVIDAGIRMQGASDESTFSVLTGCKFNVWGQARNIGDFSKQGSYKYGLFTPFRIKTIYQWAPYLGVQWNFPTNVKSTCKWRLDDKLNPMTAQMNVGVGMLYFKKARANLVSRPPQNGNAADAWQTARLDTNELSYNRTPLFEYLVQHQFNRFFQLGVSYQNQAGIAVQTQALGTSAQNTFVGDYAQLVSSLSLDALMVKGYVKMPIFSRDCRVNLSPYFGFGAGPGWQTWNNTALTLIGFSSTAGTGLQGGFMPLKQQISANVVFNLDFGAQLTHRNNNSFLSIVGGCKYNFWGQARNIGKITKQGSLPYGLNAPFIIKNIYQWAPYLGVQWNFPNHAYSKKPYYLDGRSPNTLKPYWIPIGIVQASKSLFTQFNVGIGFLYFNRARGNLMVNPEVSNFNVAVDVPLKGRLSYNRTPLFEYQLGYRLFSSLKVALSYQHQGNIAVSSKFIEGGAGTGTFQSQRSGFSSDLVLDGILAKVYYELPKAMVWRSLVTSPYFAVGLGTGWQTWKRIQINQTLTSGGYFNEFEVPLRQKVSANVIFMWDAGVRMQSPYPNSGFSTTLGLKFNLWGQARNMGKMSQQLTPTYGLGKPVRVASVYQWAPYVGVQWNF